MAHAKYDRDADALYIRLADGDVTRTVEVDDYRVLDMSDDGRVLGIEVLYPDQNLQLAPVAREYGFADALYDIDHAVEAVLGAASTKVTVALSYQLPVLQPTTFGLARSRDTTADIELVVVD